MNAEQLTAAAEQPLSAEQAELGDRGLGNTI